MQAMGLTVSLDDITPTPPAPCALQQHPRYGAAMRAIGADVACWTLRQNGQIRATAQLLRRRFGPLSLSWMARGPVVAPETTPDVLSGLTSCSSGLVIPETARLAQTYRDRGHRAVLTPQHVAELDLNGTPAARLAAQHGKWRNRLRMAEAAKLDIECRPFDPATDRLLLDLETAQRRQRRYNALPTGFTLAYASTARNATLLCLARDSTGPAAFMLFLLHDPVATYHVGWTSPQGRQTHAHTLLLWQASTALADRGFTRLDLGGIDTEAAPGLARFKLGSGARARSLGPTLLALKRPFRRARAA